LSKRRDEFALVDLAHVFKNDVAFSSQFAVDLGPIVTPNHRISTSLSNVARLVRFLELARDGRLPAGL
jgi:hypothetical protein